jgi:hypothetical protein
MIRRRSELSPERRNQADRVIWAFSLLALGDTGHVGFRIWAYALGGLESTIMIAGRPVGLVGLGTLMTSVTVTLFYVLLLDLWRVRYHKHYAWFQLILLAFAAVRLLLMFPAANQWNSVVPPQPWSFIRNTPLLVLGLGVAFLFIRDGRAAKERAFTWIGIMILVSYACYLPVILFVQLIPAVGMLMIPKTLAYVAIGFLAYFDIYQARQMQPSSLKQARQA